VAKNGINFQPRKGAKGAKKYLIQGKGFVLSAPFCK
jgi:hypothetical protein